MNIALIRLLVRLEGRAKLLGVLVSSVAVAMLDVISLLLIFPILLIVSGPVAGFDPSRLPGPLGELLGAAPGKQELYWLGAGLVGMIVIKNLASVLVFRMQLRAARTGVIRLSRRLLRGYLAAPLEFHLGRTNAQYLRGIGYLPNTLYMQGALACCNLIAEAGGFLVVTLVLILLQPVGVLLALLLLGTLVYLNYRVMGGYHHRWSKRSEELARIAHGSVGQIFPSIKIVKSAGAEPYLFDSFAAVQGETTQIATSRRLAQMSIRPVSEIAMMIAAVVILVGMLWSAGRAIEALPFVAVFAFGAIRLLPSINRINMYVNDLKGLNVVVKELESELAAVAPYLDAESQGVLGPTMRFSRTLELRGVAYSYPDSPRIALAGVDLTIRFGEVLGLAGASGAGKSTLVDIFLGLLEPTAGQVLVDGVPPRRDGVDHGSVGYVAQRSPAIGASVRENVAFGVPPEAIDDARVHEALAAANLTETIEQMPGGLDAKVGEFGVKLSGGQRQRLGIARALYGRPSLLILDEATSDLDPRTEFEVTSAINRLRGQRTIVLVAHRMHLFKACDRVLFLDKGRAVGLGTYDEMMMRVPEFRELVMMTERHGLPEPEIEREVEDEAESEVAAVTPSFG